MEPIDTAGRANDTPLLPMKIDISNTDKIVGISYIFRMIGWGHILGMYDYQSLSWHKWSTASVWLFQTLMPTADNSTEKDERG